MTIKRQKGRPRADTGKPQSGVRGVYYRDDGKPCWEVRIRWTENGQKRSLKTRSWPVDPKAARGEPTNVTTARRAAEKEATAEWASLEGHGKPKSALPSAWTFGQILEDYLEGLEAGTITPKAAATEKSVCRILLGTSKTHPRGFPFLTNKNLSDLTTDDFLSTAKNNLSLRTTRVKKNGEAVHLATLDRDLNVIRAVFKHAREIRGIEMTNPLASIKGLSSDKPRDRTLVPGEWDKIMAALAEIPNHRGTRPHVIDAIHFVRQTAARRGECVKLNWENIDLVERTAQLLNTKSRNQEEERNRTIPLPLDVWRLVLARASAAIDPLVEKNWAEMEESELAQAAIDLTNRMPAALRTKPVFTNGNGTRLRADALTQAWNDARERAGLVESADKKKRVRIHDLRHTRITELGTGKELSPLEVARISGHTDVKMLMRYFNPTAADMVGPVDALDRKRKAPLPKSAIEDIVDTLMSLSGDERSQVMSRLFQRMDGR